jgi:hypothetical protein
MTLPRGVFFSFHYAPDNWRVSQVRNIGAVEGNPIARDNDWQEVVRQGEGAIARWIDNQMVGRSCVVVLIGAQTAQRKWIDYEITKAWEKGKGIVGVHIHNLKDREQRQTYKGTNPFSHLQINRTPLSSIVETYDPPYSDSAFAYRYIADNLGGWIERAISIRANQR